MRHFVRVMLLFAFTFFSLFGAPEEPPRETDDAVYSELSDFLNVLKLIRQRYPDPGKVTYRKLLRGAMKGMLNSLDRFSDYEEPAKFKNTVDLTRGSFAGIGATVSDRSGRLCIVSVIGGSPAGKAGLRAGDQISSIDGKKTSGISLSENVSRLKGKAGTPVKLEVYRPSDDSKRTLQIIRSKISVSSIRNQGMIGKFGYFRIANFTATTAADIDKFMTEHKNLEGLIIDLRNNPGGLLQSAVQTCSRFLPEEKLVVSVEGRTGPAKKMNTTDCRRDLKTPVVILINGYSASAAEIFSGCLKDYKRAVLVGERSFGKGSVQSMIPLPDGSGIRLTIAKYFTPSRRLIHGHGIEPDIRVDLPPAASAAVSMHLMQQGKHVPLLKKGKYKDEQLTRAVEVLKGISVFRNNMKKL